MLLRNCVVSCQEYVSLNEREAGGPVWIQGEKVKKVQEVLLWLNCEEECKMWARGEEEVASRVE